MTFLQTWKKSMMKPNIGFTITYSIGKIAEMLPIINGEIPICFPWTCINGKVGPVPKITKK